MDETLLGTIMLFPYNFVPQGWHLCDGSLVDMQRNMALFSLLNTTFGGDGRTTFGLPDLNTPDNPLTKDGKLHFCICMQGIYPQRP